jgi:hypothetical protein
MDIRRALRAAPFSFLFIFADFDEIYLYKEKRMLVQYGCCNEGGVPPLDVFGSGAVRWVSISAISFPVS